MLRNITVSAHYCISNKVLLDFVVYIYLFYSEVWRAFDLDENKYVACKIHHVNKEWKEDKKVIAQLILKFLCIECRTTSFKKLIFE